jgi:hypothetical protein
VKLNQYDRKVISLIVVLTVSVLNLMALITIATPYSIGTLWYMPVGWFIGAMMVWAYGKVQDSRH